jgi:hypothetical protein
LVGRIAGPPRLISAALGLQVSSGPGVRQKLRQRLFFVILSEVKDREFIDIDKFFDVLSVTQ